MTEPHRPAPTAPDADRAGDISTRRAAEIAAGLDHVRARIDAACTAAGKRPRLRDELTRTSTMLLAWSLEHSVERADAMRARGWESGRPRTNYRL